MNRNRNWSVDIMLWARSVRGRPFEWGSTDCGSLARGALEALYGPQDVRDLFGAPWADGAAARDAWAALADVAAVFGAHEVEPAYMQTGDLVIFPGGAEEDPELPRIAVSLGDRLLVSSVRHGVEITPVGRLGEAVVWRFPA